MWPLAGMIYFATHPRLWLQPIVATLLSGTVTLLICMTSLFFLWPDQPAEIGLWSFLWEFKSDIFSAIAITALILLVLWIFAIPLYISLAYEKLVRRVFSLTNVSVNEEALVDSAKSSLHMLIRTLPWRLFWLIMSILTLVLMMWFPLVSACVSAIGMGHIAVLDACDVSLSIRGVSGKERSQLMAENRMHLLGAGLLSGIAGTLLSLTFIGWFFWLPGMYVGASLVTPHWLLGQIEK